MGGLAASPGGQQVAFGEDTDRDYTHSRHSKTEGLWLATSRGTGLHRLLYPPASTVGNTLGIGPVAWSHDGTTLAYAVNIAGDVERVDPAHPEVNLGVWLTRYDSPRPRFLATPARRGALLAPSSSIHYPTHAPVTGLSWSPDGPTLAASIGYADTNIVAIDVATGKTRLLVRGGHDGVFSPTTGALACVTGEPGPRGGMTLWVADGQGHHARAIVATHGGLIAGPAWSPDGRGIAYIAGSPIIVGGTAIRTVDLASGTNRVALTTGKYWQHPAPTEGYFVHIAWMRAGI